MLVRLVANTTTFGLLLMLLVTLSIVWTDAYQRQISNVQCLAVTTVVLALTGLQSFSLWPWLGAVASGCLFYQLRLLAGGDIKLILAYLTGIPVSLWYELSLVMAVLGGLQAVAWLLADHVRGTSTTKERGLPYGVAIGATGMCGIALSVLGATPS